MNEMQVNRQGYVSVQRLDHTANLQQIDACTAAQSGGQHRASILLVAGQPENHFAAEAEQLLVTDAMLLFAGSSHCTQTFLVEMETCNNDSSKIVGLHRISQEQTDEIARNSILSRRGTTLQCNDPRARRIFLNVDFNSRNGIAART
jgi:hypothetical protein